MQLNRKLTHPINLPLSRLHCASCPQQQLCQTVQCYRTRLLPYIPKNHRLNAFRTLLNTPQSQAILNTTEQHPTNSQDKNAIQYPSVRDFPGSQLPASQKLYDTWPRCHYFRRRLDNQQSRQLKSHFSCGRGVGLFSPRVITGRPRAGGRVRGKSAGAPLITREFLAAEGPLITRNSSSAIKGCRRTA